MGQACCNSNPEGREFDGRPDVKFMAADNLDQPHAPAHSKAQLMEVENLSQYFEKVDAVNDGKVITTFFSEEVMHEGNVLGPYYYQDTGSTYYGQYKDGNRHGQGLVLSAEQNLFRGTFFNDVTSGPGILV